MGMLDNQVVMVTGGARGQGRAHAVVSAQAGADVVIIDVDQPVGTLKYDTATAEDLAETQRLVEAEGRRCLARVADVRDQSQLDAVVSEALETFGQIDALIANAGIWSGAPFWEMTDEVWDTMIDINLTGVWKSAKAVAPHMIERQSGSIVIISSVNGLEPGFNFAHYTAAKHGVIGLMKTIALELAPYGVRCNSINPGAVRSGMTDNQAAWDMYAGHEGGTLEDLITGGYHYHALRGRTFMQPEVIANTALYLNSELAGSVTGVTIPVEAGHLLLMGQNAAPVRE